MPHSQASPLSDAMAGVAGSLVSLWTFYPIEVWKTNLQAGHSSSTERKPLFQGCAVKTLHTTSSNFCYFFLYSWILGTWKRRRSRGEKLVHPGTRLVLSAIAAMLNTFITLPLDVISSKQVTQSTSDAKKRRMEEVWETLREEENNIHAESFQECLTFDEEKGEDALSSEQCGQTSSVSVSEDEKTDPSLEISEANDNSYSTLWKGLTPALLLCSNPSINYTVFDMTKNLILSRRRSRSRSSLSMPEAFLVGLFAKFVATIITYPLIRAKVILMVTSEKSLLGSLMRSYKKDGVRGLYKGCDWQLIHTVLKSALMMMVREKISFSTHQLIVGAPPPK